MNFQLDLKHQKQPKAMQWTLCTKSLKDLKVCKDLHEKLPSPSANEGNTEELCKGCKTSVHIAYAESTGYTTH